MQPADAVRQSVQTYYGETLASTQDLRTSACCAPDALPARHKAILAEIADEVLARFYGCGSPVPPALDGCTVLDLGCGTGRDVFLAAKLVGPEGRVLGIDMTEEQLAVARRHEARQAERFGFERPNTSFRYGLIEDLAAAGVESESVDVVISNCVINLAHDKRRVFEEIWRVLKPGGELYFSDVFCDRRLPADVQADPVLRGECLGGALYEEDFRRLMQEVGWLDHRIVEAHEVEVEDEALRAQLGAARFFSRTVRAFKLASLEDRCEDYGQVAYYLGGLEEAPSRFALDDHHVFERDRPMLVCGNTAAMAEETRYAPHFRVVGDRSQHFGLFDCVPVPAEDGGIEGGCC